MMISQVTRFLLPQDNALQITFLVIIVSLTAFGFIATLIEARPSKWQKNWDAGGTGLDIDHGSVTDISYAVATWSENMANAMPGILLVIGLLGTFINLGLALNDASRLLGHANALNPRNASSTMANIMGLLQGLGAKFKTSTWGIIGFLTLRSLNGLVGYDAKRLRWSIQKIKEELNVRKKTQNDGRQLRYSQLLSEIDRAGKELVYALMKQTSRLIAEQDRRHKEASEQQKNSIEVARAGFSELTNASRETVNLNREFSSNVASVIEKMSVASKEMVVGAEKVGDAAVKLTASVSQVGIDISSILDTVRTDLKEAIADMSKASSNTLEKATTGLKDSSNEIKCAVEGMSGSTTTALQAIKDSIEEANKTQKTVSGEFLISSEHLNETVVETKSLIERLGRDIQDGLSSVANAAQKVESMGEKVSDQKVLCEIRELLISLTQAMNGAAV